MRLPYSVTGTYEVVVLRYAMLMLHIRFPGTSGQTWEDIVDDPRV